MTAKIRDLRGERDTRFDECVSTRTLDEASRDFPKAKKKKKNKKKKKKKKKQKKESFPSRFFEQKKTWLRQKRRLIEEIKGREVARGGG